MIADSNIDEVCDWLEQFVRGFNFTRPGTDQSLGRDLAHVVALQIAERAATLKRGADPTRWDENEPKYAAWKERRYGWVDAPNYRTGQMLSHESLMGRTVVSEDTVEMHYGTDTTPQGSKAPTGAITSGDRDVTDTEKAEYCSVNRPFYELDDEIEEAVIAEAADALERYILTEG